MKALPVVSDPGQAGGAAVAREHGWWKYNIFEDRLQ